MKAAKLLVLWGLGLVVWAAPVVVDSGVAAVIMPRSQEVDEDVIYTDYKRTTQPETEDDEDVIYTDYKRTTQPETEDDEDVIYTDYKRTTQPGDFDSSKPIFNLKSTDLLISETEDDEDVIYTDY
ncbi:hypothetical protein BofuT4_P103880.1 [Botrytis cinerea T4]|uniref:Uncharacterized protein n=1 Tax=Botryotinia fuckeliana (strain T4) TaxID=999810 RepID=G2YAL9_BOTF4|nr:hypothetical protein BofuT4_P103880.1 [Botrytis cinerea T4]